jgi:hypothetical protein
MPLPPQQTPPAIVSPAPREPDAESALLEAYDWGHPLPPTPKLKGPMALEYQWLRAAATFNPGHGLPAAPFSAGRGRSEAEALRRLFKAPGDQLGTALKALPLHESGTALALWRWGQVQVRNGRFDATLRRSWEDRLLGAGPALTRGYALRHALCWALAEGDEARLSGLRSVAGSTSEDILKGFQRLFGLVGGPTPIATFGWTNWMASAPGSAPWKTAPSRSSRLARVGLFPVSQGSWTRVMPAFPNA